MKITRIRHLWPEEQGFIVSRPTGAGEYIFLHFLNPVEIMCGGTKHITEANTCIIYSPDEPEWFCSHVPLVHDWMHLQGDVAFALSQFGLQADTLYTVGDGDFITRTVRELEVEFNAERKYVEQFTDLKLRELFIQLARRVEMSEKSLGVSPEIIARFDSLRSEMVATLEKNWRVADMAKKVFLSEAYFYSLYKRIYGISPTQDLILARVERAKRLLAGNYKVSEIATMTGYASEYHFINQFRKIEGISPGKYAASLSEAILCASKPKI